MRPPAATRRWRSEVSAPFPGRRVFETGDAAAAASAPDDTALLPRCDALPWLVTVIEMQCWMVLRHFDGDFHQSNLPVAQRQTVFCLPPEPSLNSQLYFSMVQWFRGFVLISGGRLADVR